MESQKPTAGKMMEFQHIPKPGEKSAQKAKKKKSKGGLVFGIFFLLLIIAGIATGAVLLHSNNEDDSDAYSDFFKTNAFFIEDAESHYALFNDDGEQLTEFKFGSVQDFKDGTALVSDINDNKSGIINERGEMTVGFGKYDHINRVGPFYEVGNNPKKIINGKGRTVIDNIADDYEVISGDTFIVVKSEDGYKIINYRGNIIATIAENIEEKPKLSGHETKGNAVVVHGKINYIINSIDGELLAKIESDDECVISSISSETGDIIITATSLTSENGSRKPKAIINKNIMDLPEECDNVYYTTKGALICSAKGTNYLLDKNLEKVDSFNNILYAKHGTYAVNKSDVSDDGGGVSFFEDDSEIANTKCRQIATNTDSNESDYYLLRTTYNPSCSRDGIRYGRYEYFDTTGKKIIDADYANATPFLKNDLAIVTNDERKSFLINKNGEKVGDEYDYMRMRRADDGCYYEAYSKNEKDTKLYYLINSKGDMVKQYDDYVVVDQKQFNDTVFVSLKKEEQIQIINTSDGSIVLETTTMPHYEDHFIVVYEKNTSKYYSYNGKMIYSKE